MTKLIMAAFIGLMLLSGCASLSQDACLEGDWAAIGARDGADGRVAETQFARHIAACARIDITPDRAPWERGYTQGLQSYCTPLSGLREGEAGRPYRNVCPAETQSRFMHGHDLGQSAYRQRAYIQDIAHEIAQLQRDTMTLSGNTATDADAIAAQKQRQANQNEILMLRLQESLARAELLRIEREIRAFRAAL